MLLAAIRNRSNRAGEVPACARRRVLRLEPLEDRLVPSTLHVDDNGGTGIYTTITAALTTANAGDTIQVNDGTYVEAVTVTKNNINLVATGAHAVIQSPPSVTPTSVGGFDIGAAVVDIVGATQVKVTGFTIDGSTNTDHELFAGVRVLGNGSATIRDNTITGLTTAGNPLFGIGIQVGTFRGSGSFGTAKIDGNTITNYLKGGIIIDGAGSAGTITNNIITGSGLASPVAQNGVQVSADATARIENNTITNNNFNDPNVTATGVLIDTVSSKKTVVARNTIDQNQAGLYVLSSSQVQVVNNDVTHNGNSGGIVLDASDNNTVKNNFVNQSQVDGIDLYDANNNEVGNNDVSGSGSDGIFVSGGQSNTLRQNDSFSNGQDGIHLFDSSDNTLQGNGTWGNSRSGVFVEGGQGNLIRNGDSSDNIQDGITLMDTQNNTVKSNDLECNGGYGLRLINADNTLVTRNLIEDNAAGSVFIDSDSTGTVLINNDIDTPVTREAVGAAYCTVSYQNCFADADTATACL